MNKKLAKALLGIATTTALILPGVGAQATNIAGSGSSFAYNGIYKCASLYEAHNVTYTSTGSGTGRTNFRTAQGSYAFAVSDGLYSAGTEPTGYTMTPLFGGPVVFAYNKFSGIPAGLQLTGSLVSQILKGTIKKWNDPKIKAANTTKVLPNLAIKVFFRSGTSGTNENLSRYLKQTVSATTWSQNQDLTLASVGGLKVGAVAKATSSLLADAVESSANKGAFGYFDLSDAKTANVNLVKLRNAAGQYISPTAASGALFLAGHPVITATGDRLDGVLGTAADPGINFKRKVLNAYQLTIVTYGIGDKAGDTANDAAVEAFFNYVVKTCMPAQAARLGYVALTGNLKAKAIAQIAVIGQ